MLYQPANMRISKKLLIIWILLFIPFFFGYFYFKFKRYETDAVKKRQLITNHIGEKFKIGNVIDTSGADVNVTFERSDLTIIDFWFNTCPPCIEEMQQFNSLLQKQEGKISVISVSINSFNVWSSLFRTQNPAFSFLLKPNKNWTHVALKSNENPNLKQHTS